MAYALGNDIGDRYDEWLKDIVNILREGPEAKVADFTKPHSFNCKFITGKTAVEDLEGRKRWSGNTVGHGCCSGENGNDDHWYHSENWKGIPWFEGLIEIIK